MKYSQKVDIVNIDFDKVKSAFHQYSFIQFLTKLQPVKILSWEGIQTGKKAKFKFWFFYWHTLIVCHEEYLNTNLKLSFIDRGVMLPMGIKSWNHLHVVIKHDNSVVIEDYFEFTHKNKHLEILMYPIMIMPIFIRKISYKLFFKKQPI